MSGIHGLEQLLSNSVVGICHLQTNRDLCAIVGERDIRILQPLSDNVGLRQRQWNAWQRLAQQLEADVRMLDLGLIDYITELLLDNVVGVTEVRRGPRVEGRDIRVRHAGWGGTPAREQSLSCRQTELTSFPPVQTPAHLGDQPFECTPIVCRQESSTLRKVLANELEVGNKRII